MSIMVVRRLARVLGVPLAGLVADGDELPAGRGGRGLALAVGLSADREGSQ